MKLKPKRQLPAIAGAKGGGKGGGGSGRAALETPDTLRSSAFATLLLAISEGEIEGLVAGMKSIYLDGTPVQNADGTFNFSGFQYDVRNGSQDQTHIALAGNVEVTRDVGTVEVKNSSPVVRTITDPDVNEVRLIVSTPNLSQQSMTTGDITGTSVTMAVLVQANGGGFAEKLRFSMTGKKVSRYQKAVRVRLTGSPPWDIKLVRITADNGSSTLNNRTYWDQYVEIITAKLRYPNTALLAGRIDSSQFGSIPVVAGDFKLLRVQVPTNYDPVTRKYTGVWNGNFKTAWTDNPAWVLYDMLATERYGCGQYISAAAMESFKWDFYAAGQYCDVMVPNGFGGFEPRFTCNIYFQERRPAYQVIRDLASVMRAMTYWQTNSIAIAQDAPADPGKIFTNANVVDGRFSYQGSALKTRHTVALVSWNDPNDLYRQKIEYVEDLDGIRQYGINETEVIAVGCTSRGQAHRVGRWLLVSELLENETVTFKTGIDSALTRPGQIFQVHDKSRAGTRYGGRVVAMTGSDITLDAAPDLSIGGPFYLSVVMPDGRMETQRVVAFAGPVLTLEYVLSDSPLPGAIWVIKSDLVDLQKFRCVTMVETGGMYEIAGLKHIDGKYDLVERDIVLQPTQNSVLVAKPNPPGGILISESLYETPTDVRVLVNIDWQPVLGAIAWEVSYRGESGNIVTLPRTQATAIDIRDIAPGDYEFYITGINALGDAGTPAVNAYTVIGKTAPPEQVGGLAVNVLDRNVAQATWIQAADLDVKINGYVRFRHSPLLSGAGWNEGIDIGPSIPGTATTAELPLLQGTYMAKFVDSEGNESATVAAVSVGSVNVLNMNVVLTNSQHPAFSGAKDGVAYDSGLGGIKLDGSVPIDDIPDDIDSWTDFDAYMGVTTSGSYRFDQTFDLGAVYTSRVSAVLKVLGYDISSLIDSRLTPIDSWTSFDGDDASQANAGLWVRTTNDDPGGTPVWTEWKPFFAGDFTCRAYQFEARLNTSFEQHNIVVQQLGVVIDMPDRTEGQANLTSPAGAFAVTYPAAFKNTPALGINAILQTGDYYQITGEAPTGFTITFRNSAGTAVSRNFSYVAKGYGRQN